MVEFLRDPNTGILYAYKDGRVVGPIVAMGDPINVPPTPSRDLYAEAHGRSAENG